jgi:APA family basic amino acid/polyamine antiporter
MGYPVFKSLNRNWEKEQLTVLTSAEEFELVEEYKGALAERDKRLGARVK